MHSFSFATLKDLDNIMKFMNDYWRKDHILSRNRELFLYEFQDGNNLNIGLAKDDRDKIIGIFGWIKYNAQSLPDIGGSLWKVVDDAKIPMLGLKLRNYVVDNVPHRFYASPGAGLQTRPIYRLINMDWNRMNQYYRLNPVISAYHIATIPQTYKHKRVETPGMPHGFSVKLIKDTDELLSFDFAKYTDILPFKDYEYIKKRFFTYPIYKYDVYALFNKDKIENIFICRLTEHNGAFAYRVVDFYGAETYMQIMSDFLFELIQDKKYEYFDFISHGFNEEIMKKAGLQLLNFASDKVIIPNFFEPFVSKNIPVYCVSNHTDKVFRQCKADGDQDRPNRNV